MISLQHSACITLQAFTFALSISIASTFCFVTFGASAQERSAGSVQEGSSASVSLPRTKPTGNAPNPPVESPGATEQDGVSRSAEDIGAQGESSTFVARKVDGVADPQTLRDVNEKVQGAFDLQLAELPSQRHAEVGEDHPTTASLHSAAPHHLPWFITAPGKTDNLMVGVGVFLIVVVMAVGILFLRLHTLPERIAHRGHKLQFEIVAVLGLLALFTHMHIFWVIGLLLALIDFPNFGGPLNRIAGSLENIAGNVTGQDAAETPDETVTGHAPDEGTAEARTRPELTLVSPNESSAPSGEHKEPIHA
jgi:hypothetical protein